MEQLPMMVFSETLLKAGVSGWWYDFIAMPWFDVIDDQFSFLSRGRAFLFKLIWPKFRLDIDMEPSPWCVFFPSVVDLSWLVLSPTDMTPDTYRHDRHDTRRDIQKNYYFF